MSSLSSFEIITTTGAAIFLLAFGFVSVMRPERVQEYALKHGKRYYFWPNPLLGWMKTPGYLIYVRFMGVFSLCLGIFLLILLRWFR
jgi:hypothetical protein